MSIKTFFNSNFTKLQALFVIALLSLLTLSLPVSAQQDLQKLDPCVSTGINCVAQQTLGEGDFGKAVGNAITTALPIIIGIAVAMGIWAAFQYITNKPEDGMKIIKNTIIGVVIALLSVTVVSFVVRFITGIN